jgi:hypothetical protein
MLQVLRTNVFRRLISSLIVFTIIASDLHPLFSGRVLAHAAEPQSGESATAEEKLVAKAIENLDKAIEVFDSNSKAQMTEDFRKSRILGLRGQRFEIFDAEGKVTRSILFNGETPVNLSSFIPPEFNSSVKYGQSSEGELVLKVYDKNILKGQFVIPEIKPKNIIFDNDFVVVLDTANEIHVMDHAFVRKQFLKSPLPIVDSVKLSTLPQGLSMEWVTPTTALPSLPESMKVQEKSLFRMKNLLVFSNEENGQRKLLANIDRDALGMIVFARLSSLALLLPSEGPNDANILVDQPAERKSSIDKVPTLAKLAADPEIRKNAASLQKNFEAHGMIDALYSIPSSTLADLIGRASHSESLRKEFNLPEVERSRFRFRYEEVLRNHSALVEKQKKESGIDPETPEKVESQMRAIREGVWKNLRTVLSPLNLFRIVGLLGLGGIATASSPDAYLFQARIVIYEKLSNFINIFKNPEYADVAILSTLCLSFLVPATNLIGRALDKFGPASLRGVGVKRALGTLGMRIYSLTMPLFIHGLARVLKQPLMTEAMRHGINPFTLVRLQATDPVGKQLLNEGYAKTSQTLRLGFGKQSTQEARERALQIMANEKRRRLSLSSAIAFQIAADSYGQDPSLVAALANLKLEDIQEAKLKELIKDKTFRAKWLYLGQEISAELISLKQKEGIADLQNLSKEEIGVLFERAKFICEKLERMSSLRKNLTFARSSFKNWYQSQLREFSTYGLDAVDFLKHGHPSNFVTNLFYTQFSADVALSVWQIPFFGTRADLANTKALAADPHGFLWTNKNHLGDMVDQVRLYNINAPSSYALTYDFKGAQNAEESLPDLDKLMSEGLERQEGPFSTLSRWARNAADLRKQNYGFFFWKTFKRRLFSIQSYFLWGVTTRCLSTDQSIGQSFLASTWAYFMAHWYFGLLWDFANNGQDAALQEIASRTETFSAKKTKLLKLLREGSSSGELLSKTIDLLDAYAENTLPKSSSESLKIIHAQTLQLNQRFLENKENIQETQYRLRLEQALAEVHDVIFANYEKIGDSERKTIQSRKVEALDKAIADAQVELSSFEKDLPNEIRLNALSLLQFSLKNPNFGNAYNSKMNKMITFFFAWTTTLYGTYLFAHSQVNQPWLAKAAIGSLEGIGLYVLAFHGQRAFNYVWDNGKEFISKKVEGIKKVGAALGCISLLRGPRK